MFGFILQMILFSYIIFKQYIIICYRDRKREGVGMDVGGARYFWHKIYFIIF